MARSWNVLVVDDEEDVHNITKLALKRKSWRRRPIALTSARSGAEARQILAAPDAPRFHAALVDVVMESDDAGLQLCDYIRSHVPRTTRIIMRTGQPGLAPPEHVLSEYDIDYYLAKTEVTPDKLFLNLRACFRSSTDIGGLVAVGDQLKAFTVALQDAATTRETLAQIMMNSLRFVEDKHGVELAFVHDLSAPPQLGAADPRAVAQAIQAAHDRELQPMELHPGEPLGLGADTHVCLTARLATVERDRSLTDKLKRWFRTALSDPGDERPVGIVVRTDEPLAPRMRAELVHDLNLFVANWRMADSALRLQDRLVRERVEMAKSLGQV